MLITIDVEDHTIPPATPRFAEALAPLLETLSRHSIRATFFVVGELVDTWKGQLRELADAGHEIGLHGYTHQHLGALGEQAFADEVARGVDVLGELLGTPPAGFRAPFFSMTRATPWAPGILQSAGFAYSSSVLPAWNPQAGFPGAPRSPFRWECGLLELPAPVLGLGKFALPVLGGAYVRLVPGFVVRLAARSASADSGHWSYSHPYDFDADEPFFRRPGQSWVVAKLLFARRRQMLERVARLAPPNSGTLAEFAASLALGAPAPVFVSR